MDSDWLVKRIFSFTASRNISSMFYISSRFPLYLYSVVLGVFILCQIFKSICISLFILQLFTFAFSIVNGGGETKYPPSSFTLNCKGILYTALQTFEINNVLLIYFTMWFVFTVYRDYRGLSLTYWSPRILKLSPLILCYTCASLHSKSPFYFRGVVIKLLVVSFLINYIFDYYW